MDLDRHRRSFIEDQHINISVVTSDLVASASKNNMIQMPNSKAAKRQLNPSSWGLEVFEGGLKELLRAVVDACYWNTRLLIAPWLRFNEPFQLSHSMFKSLSRWSTNQCEPHNILSKHTTRFQLKKGVDMYGGSLGLRCIEVFRCNCFVIL